MVITIKSESLNSHKRIFADYEALYIAKPMAILSSDHLKLFHLKTGYVTAILSREVSVFKDEFKIRLLNENNVSLKFTRIDIWAHGYKGVYLENHYEVKPLGTFDYSIYRNGAVIVRWKNVIGLGEIDDFEILSIDNDLELLVCLCLIIQNKQCQRRNPD